jgi:hypothetical protein
VYINIISEIIISIKQTNILKFKDIMIKSENMVSRHKANINLSQEKYQSSSDIEEEKTSKGIPSQKKRNGHNI